MFDEFLKTITPIHKKIGVLMFQFEYMNKSKMSGLSELSERFEMFLSKIDSPFALGIEIRNPWYLNKYYFDFLQRNNLSHVFLQGYFMPPIVESYNKFKDKILRPVVIRLHGPDRKEIEETTGNWNQIVSPKNEELPKVVDMINYFSSKSIDVYLIVNNQYMSANSG